VNRFLFAVSVIFSFAAVSCANRGAAPQLGAESGQVSFPKIVQTGQPPTSWVQVPLTPGNHSTEFITAGPDNAMWVAQAISKNLARVAMDGTVTEYPLPNTIPLDIAVGSDKKFYVNGGGGIGVLQVDTSGTVTGPFFPPSGNSVNLLSLGPDGNMWFTEGQASTNPLQIGEISPAGVITEHDFHHPNVGSISSPFQLVTGPDGNVWFTNNNENSIANLNPSTGAVTNYPLAAQGINCRPSFIIVGPDRLIWTPCTNQTTNKTYLVRITTAGVATAKALKLAGFSLTMGPDKAVWMVGATLIRITTSGAETSFKLPSTYFNGRTIAVGPDGNIWLSGLSESTSQQHVLVRVLRVLTVTPAMLTFTGVGQMQTLSVTEKSYSGSWTAVSSNTGVATVAPGARGKFVVTSAGSGNCTVTVSDKNGVNSFPVAVTVP
jgi:virginiamycin B lyase